jgi:hypothetical protein
MLKGASSYLDGTEQGLPIDLTVSGHRAAGFQLGNQIRRGGRNARMRQQQRPQQIRRGVGAFDQHARRQVRHMGG